MASWFCSIGLCVSFYASIILFWIPCMRFWLLYFCNHFEIRKCDTFNFVLLSQNSSSYLRSLWFHKTLGFLPISVKNYIGILLHWIYRFLKKNHLVEFTRETDSILDFSLLGCFWLLIESVFTLFMFFFFNVFMI